MRVQFRSIVCATDFSDFSNRTIPYGVAIAKEFDSRLIVCHVIDLSAIAIYGEFQLDPMGQQLRIQQDAQEQLAKLPGLSQISWEPLIAVGPPAAEIARIVEERGLDLVVVSTRGRSGLKRLILGSVTERLMRTLSCPLLAVQGPEEAFLAEGSAGIRLKKIVVGCDFSDDSLLARDYGLSLAQEFEAELHLLHVVEPPAYAELLKPGGTARDAIVGEVVAEKLEALVPADSRHWCSPKVSVLQGQPYEELVRYAVANDIDMIVLGTRGYGLVKSLLMGSTTDRVLRHSPCPVLTVSAERQAHPAARH